MFFRFINFNMDCKRVSVLLSFNPFGAVLDFAPIKAKGSTSREAAEILTVMSRTKLEAVGTKKPTYTCRFLGSRWCHFRKTRPIGVPSVKVFVEGGWSDFMWNGEVDAEIMIASVCGARSEIVDEGLELYRTWLK